MPKQPMHQLTGLSFGRLTVISYIKGAKWECICECGELAFPTGHNLVSGKSASCGCLHREISKKVNTVHGLISNRKEYEAWAGAKKRCFNKATKAYSQYGGRGITMAESWASSFEQFFNDMGPKPTDKHSLDRIDNDGPYSPENCRWATPKEQNRNRRSNLIVDVNGTSKPLVQACEELGVEYDLVNSRMLRGWSFDEAIRRPRRKIRSRGFSKTRDFS